MGAPPRPWPAVARRSWCRVRAGVLVSALDQLVGAGAHGEGVGAGTVGVPAGSDGVRQPEPGVDEHQRGGQGAGRQPRAMQPLVADLAAAQLRPAADAAALSDQVHDPGGRASVLRTSRYSAGQRCSSSLTPPAKPRFSWLSTRCTPGYAWRSRAALPSVDPLSSTQTVKAGSSSNR